MPILKGKYQHVKVARPPGTPYADGAGNWPGFLSEFRNSSVAIGFGIEKAVNGALRAFELEFGRPPHPEYIVIEVVTTHRGATARVYEIDPDRNDDTANSTHAGATPGASQATAG